MSEANFGFRIPAFLLNDSQGQDFRNEIVNYIAAVEGQYASAWVADHFLPWYKPLDPITDTLECCTTQVYLSGKFWSYDIGSIVLSQSYRNPGLLAKMGATLHLLSEGGFILGIDPGWKHDEYLAYGYDFSFDYDAHSSDGGSGPDYQSHVDVAKDYLQG